MTTRHNLFVRTARLLLSRSQEADALRSKRRGRAMRYEQLEARALMAADLALDVDQQMDWDEAPPKTASLLIGFKSTSEVPSSLALAAAGQVASANQLIPGVWKLDLPNSVSIDSAMQQLASDPRVDFVEQDQPIRGSAWLPDDPLFSKQWAHHNQGQSGGKVDADIDSVAAWKVTKGTGKTVVAVVDTGVDWQHPDLKANIWRNGDEIPDNGIDDDRNGFVDDIRGWDFWSGDNNPADGNGHGTHVAGIIGARGDNDRGVAGLNWNVDIMPLRFLNKDGQGYLSDAISAIEYAIANDAHISNHSWGGGSYSAAFAAVVRYAQEHNHILVVAAGNEGLSLDGNNAAYPASYNRWYDNVVTVAASNSKDRLASFSNYGNNVDIAAPGVNILSTVRRDDGSGKTKGYDTYSGTSMATPFVTGAMSLVRDLHPEWSYREVIDHVLSTADRPASLNKVVEGSRRLNVGRAVTQAAATAFGQASAAIASSDRSIAMASNEPLPQVAVQADQHRQVSIAMTASGAESDSKDRENDVGDQSVVTLAGAEDSIPTEAKYKITVKGSVNGKCFQVQGTLLVRGTINEHTLNGVNPRDIFLKIGDPLANPKRGAIWLATNNAFFEPIGYIPASQKMDLAHVKLNESTAGLSIKVDSDLVASGLNRFNSRGGLLASMYQVYQGGVNLKFKSKGETLTGKIELKGTTAYIPGHIKGAVSYEATVTGVRVS